ncbi:MAG: NYN domain-containing protein [Lachnospiraceae bacterium]|nr:NYN domain-containing protein [Lachnospiraceae bacterium]
MSDDRRFAVLIDIENISRKYVELILDEASNYGDLTIKRAYGDWTKAESASWRNELLENSIIPMQQFNNTFGKNSSDSALIIDAMKILYSSNVDGFCLVSSDSDFTRLAATLKEEGKIVVGMGESKTPNALIKACDSFKMLDVLYKEANAEKEDKRKASKTAAKTAASATKSNTAKKQTNNLTKLSTIEKAIKQIIIANDDEVGMNMGALGNSLQRRYPDFDTRNYGSSKFSKFLEQFSSLSVIKVDSTYYVSLAENAKDKK